MVMQSLRSGASKGFLKYTIFGLLGMAVGGLVVMDVRGVLGGRANDNDVAQIENHKITIQDFDRTVQRNLAQYRGYGITAQQAYKLGLVDQILTGEIRKYFLLTEAEKYGIEIDNEQLKFRIAEIIKPQMQEGETMQQTLDSLLRAQGLTEKQFIDEVKKELTVELLTDAITDGFAPGTDILAGDLFQFQNQTRDIEILLLPDTDIKDLEPATEEQLTSLYEALKRQKYKIPEYRSVQAAVFDPEKTKIEVSVSDEEIQQIYDENPEAFSVDEQLVLTQALFQEEKPAQEVYDLVQTGISLKDAVEKISGDEAQYVEKVPFETNAMLPTLDEALKDREIGKIVGPAQSPLGFHILRLDDIIPPFIKPLEAVKEQIRNELSEEKKAEKLYGIASGFEKLLNEGNSFETIAETIDLQIFTIEDIDAIAMLKNGEAWKSDILKGEDVSSAVQSIFALTPEDEFSIMEELPSGKFVAFKLKSSQPETYTPFENVKPELNDQFIADQQNAQNEIRTKKLLAELETGGSTLQSIAQTQNKKIQRIEKITINGPIAEPLNDAVRPVIFKTAMHSHEMLKLDKQYALIKIVAHSLPEIPLSEGEQMTALRETLDQEAKDEALLMYIRQLNQKYEAKINKALLERTYGSPDETN